MEAKLVRQAFGAAMTARQFRPLRPSLWLRRGRAVFVAVEIGARPSSRVLSCCIGVRIAALPGPAMSKQLDLAKCHVRIGPAGISHVLFGDQGFGDEIRRLCDPRSSEGSIDQLERYFTDVAALACTAGTLVGLRRLLRRGALDASMVTAGARSFLRRG